MASPAPYVPYQPYKSKRHARDTSNHSVANGTVSTPQPSRRPQPIFSNGHGDSGLALHQRAGSLNAAEASIHPRTSPVEGESIPRPVSMFDTLPQHGRSDSTIFKFPVRTPPIARTPSTENQSTMSPARSLVAPPITTPHSSPSRPAAPASPAHSTVAVTNGGAVVTLPPTFSSPLAPPTPLSMARIVPVMPNGAPSSESVAGPSSAADDRPLASPRKSSTFRHVPLRNPNVRPPLPSSPLRTADTHSRTPSITSTHSRQPELPPPLSQHSSQGSSSTPSSSITPTYDRDLPAIPAVEINPQSRSPSEDVGTPPPTFPIVPATPPPRAHSVGPSPGPLLRTLSPGPAPSSSQSSSPAVSQAVRDRSVARSPAPYRLGFQPKGVYRPRTDEFIEARKLSRDVGRVEHSRLERRLEKLINLHFPSETQTVKEKVLADQRHTARPNKRLPSIFEIELSDLRSKSATDLWRDVVQSQATPGSRNDIRAAEQSITPWEEDASITQCPLCKATFHPLTNRKHHCRLCGRIICSLPVKLPQRPQQCSLLFVADPKTGRIEEVSEGVDYGVRRRSASLQVKAREKGHVVSEDEKFLKGVRICRDCRPVLLREQYKQEARSVPIFFKLYGAFISLEKEIEDSLPQFQELVLTLSKHERPTPEASAARKRLLEAFGQYDTLAKRIRQLPTPGGSSQDRMQAAIASRANQFLQKNMFPLQALPKPTDGTAPSIPAISTSDEPQIDPNSELARTLQPLLEQEALLESFVEEAKAHRKFEDVKTLKGSLQEIRAEINRIVAYADASVAGNSRRGSRTRRS